MSRPTPGPGIAGSSLPKEERCGGRQRLLLGEKGTQLDELGCWRTRRCVRLGVRPCSGFKLPSWLPAEEGLLLREVEECRGVTGAGGR